MKIIKIVLTILVLSLLIQCTSKTNSNSDKIQQSSCVCDTINAFEIINDSTFNVQEIYDNENFLADSLYSLSSDQNKELWYRDIQNPDTTKFTKYWNSYVSTNYHVNPIEFQEYFDKRENVELAFLFGPNMDLWAYHIFVIRKLDCCYLITRNYFRHARFTYKAFGIINDTKLDSLYQVINSIKPSKVDIEKQGNYSGYFVDNKQEKIFFVDFIEAIKKNSGKPLQEITNLYDFVDNRIKWNVTYE